MSHTVLKASSSSTRKSTAVLDEITGRFEVYWEQFRRMKWNRRPENLLSKSGASEYEEADREEDCSQTLPSEGRKFNSLPSVHRQKAGKFIEGKVVFG